MANYQHKRSSTPEAVPDPSDFKAGEILVNIADGRMFLLTTGNEVVPFSGMVENDVRYIKRAGDTMRGGLLFEYGNVNTTQFLQGFGWNGKHNRFGLNLVSSGDLELHAFNQDSGGWVRMVLRIGHDGNLTLANNPTSSMHPATKSYVDTNAVMKAATGQVLTGSYLHTPYNYGNLGSTTITLNPANGLTGKITRTSGSGTIAAPSGTPTGFFNMLISIVGFSNTGSPSLSGFDHVDGDDVPGSGQKAALYVECCPDYKLAIIKGVTGY